MVNNTLSKNNQQDYFLKKKLEFTSRVRFNGGGWNSCRLKWWCPWLSTEKEEEI
jgi:hypothetical protein